MDTGKVYFDSEGAECSIWQMVKREPTWAAVRIQEGEKAIEEITTLRQQLEQTKARVAEFERVFAKAAMSEGETESWLLRKQAEAVEAAWHGYSRESSEEDCKVLYREDMEDCVQRLRTQADAAEKEGE